MRKNLTFKKWDFELTNHSRHKWTHLAVHMHSDIAWYRRPKSRLKALIQGLRDGYVHIVFGRLSLVIEKWDIERYAVCAECESTEIGEVSSGDEGWTVCQDCRTVEGDYKYLNKREFERLSA